MLRSLFAVQSSIGLSSIALLGLASCHDPQPCIEVGLPAEGEVTILLGELDPEGVDGGRDGIFPTCAGLDGLEEGATISLVLGPRERFQCDQLIEETSELPGPGRLVSGGVGFPAGSFAFEGTCTGLWEVAVFPSSVQRYFRADPGCARFPDGDGRSVSCADAFDFETVP